MPSVRSALAKQLLINSLSECVCLSSGALEKQLGGRLFKMFVKQGSGDKEVNRQELLDRTAKDKGKCRDAPVLIWIDNVYYKGDTELMHVVAFELCHMPVGGRRQHTKTYNAMLEPAEGAPEGMVLNKLVSSE